MGLRVVRMGLECLKTLGSTPGMAQCPKVYPGVAISELGELFFYSLLMEEVDRVFLWRIRPARSVQSS